MEGKFSPYFGLVSSDVDLRRPADHMAFLFYLSDGTSKCYNFQDSSKGWRNYLNPAKAGDTY